MMKINQLLKCWAYYLTVSNNIWAIFVIPELSTDTVPFDMFIGPFVFELLRFKIKSVQFKLTNNTQTILYT